MTTPSTAPPYDGNAARRAAFLPLPEREKLTARVTDELTRFLAATSPATT